VAGEPAELEAEALRDSLLSVAGRLDPTPGGPGFQEASRRRSLYLMSVRTGAKTAEFGRCSTPPIAAASSNGGQNRSSRFRPVPDERSAGNGVGESTRLRVAREVPGETDRERIGRLYDYAEASAAETEVDVGLRFLGSGHGTEQQVKPPPLALSATEAWVRYCHLLVCNE
jgi:hypothetical protein